jgi:hypothetical protein
LEKPLSPNEQVRGLMPAFNPVSEQVLSTVTVSVIPGLRIGN